MIFGVFLCASFHPMFSLVVQCDDVVTMVHGHRNPRHGKTLCNVPAVKLSHFDETLPNSAFVTAVSRPSLNPRIALQIQRERKTFYLFLHSRNPIV